MAAQIVSDITPKENTIKQVYFSSEKVDTMQDIIIPSTLLYKNRHSSKTEEYLSKIWVLSTSQDAQNLKATT